MADEIDDILGPGPAKKPAAGGDDIDAILGTPPAPKLDKRGHEIDPRFADEEEPPVARALKNTGSYDDVMANFRGDKKAAKAASDAALAPKEGEGFFGRAFKSAAHGVNAVIDVGEDVYGTRGAALLDPAKRRQLVRGVDDVATLGYGQKLAARVGNALGDKPDVALGPETFGTTAPATDFTAAFRAAGGAPAENTQAADQSAAPEYRTVGQGLGSFTGAGAVIGKAGGAIAGRIPGVGALPGVVKGVAAYEAAAPAAAALSANAEGNRLEAAKQAATDPLGLVLSGGAGGVAGVGERPARAPSKGGQAIKNAERWVAKDIAGEVRGASTPTARMQLANDAEHVSQLVLKDHELAKAIDKATEQNVDELKHLGGVIKDRLSKVGQRLSPGWKQIDKALGDQPLTSGVVVEHVLGRAEELRATGHTTDAAEADALEAIANRLQKAKNWGANKDVKVSDKAKGDLAALEKVRANVKDPAVLKQIDEQIASIEGAGKPSSTFDPNHKISVEQLQKLWSDEAGVAYNSQGGINGTATFQRKLDVASHLRDIRDQVLRQAGATDPGAVQAISDDLSKFSALKRIEKVVEQRTNQATAMGGGASVPAEFVRKVKELKHNPWGVAIAALPEAMIAAKRRLDTRGAQRAMESRPISPAEAARNQAQAQMIVRLMNAGLPRAAAIRSAQAALDAGQPQLQ